MCERLPVIIKVHPLSNVGLAVNVPEPEANQQTGSLKKKPATFPPDDSTSGESSSIKAGTSTGSPQESPLGNLSSQGSALVSSLALWRQPSRSSRIPLNCEAPAGSRAGKAHRNGFLN